MSFASLEFLPYLALVVGLFLFVPARLRTLALLVASYAFYLWAEPWHGLLLAGSTLLDFFVGGALGRARGATARKALLGISLAANLGALVLFKYSEFFVEHWYAITGDASRDASWARLALPLGISFYTFQTLAYVIDVYRGAIAPSRDIVSFALYVSFFPQLIAGPIERAGHLIPQLERASPVDAARLDVGGRLIVWGLLKKLVMADHLAAVVRPVFDAPTDHGSLELLLAGVAMNAVLYLDFSAYTDIARGAARLFGVDLVLNFRRPFVSRSPAEFAARWHMSLFRWIADYVYSPLSGGPLTHWRLWRNNCLTMTLFGFWHGASWTFLLWGLGSGAAISVQHSLRLARARRGVVTRERAGWSARDLLPCLGTTLLTSGFVVFFFSPDLRFGLDWYARLLSFDGRVDAAWSLGVLAALAVGFAAQLVGETRDLDAAWRRVGTGGRLALWAAALAALVLLRVPDPADFIYFRF